MDASGASLTLPLDRQLPEQPLLQVLHTGAAEPGGGGGGGGGEVWYNRRALRELPHALLHAGRSAPGTSNAQTDCSPQPYRRAAPTRDACSWAELAELLCSLPWLRAKLRGMGIGAVLEDLELPPPQGRQEAAAAAQLAALGAALRQAAPILHEAPEPLEPVALVSRALALTLGPTNRGPRRRPSSWRRS